MDLMYPSGGASNEKIVVTATHNYNISCTYFEKGEQKDYQNYSWYRHVSAEFHGFTITRGSTWIVTANVDCDVLSPYSYPCGYSSVEAGNQACGPNPNSTQQNIILLK